MPNYDILYYLEFTIFFNKASNLILVLLILIYKQILIKSDKSFLQNFLFEFLFIDTY